MAYSSAHKRRTWSAIPGQAWLVVKVVELLDHVPVCAGVANKIFISVPCDSPFSVKKGKHLTRLRQMCTPYAVRLHSPQAWSGAAWPSSGWLFKDQEQSTRKPKRNQGSPLVSWKAQMWYISTLCLARQNRLSTKASIKGLYLFL